MTCITTAGGLAISTSKTSISCMLLRSLLDYFFQARTFEMSPCKRWAVNNLCFQIQGLLKAMTDQEVWGQELSDHLCILTDFPKIDAYLRRKVFYRMLVCLAWADQP